MSKVLKEKIIKMEKLTDSIYSMKIKSEYISLNAMPGQFVHLKCSEGINPLLRRPFSICRVNRIKRTFDVAFEVKGIGTSYLAKKQSGSLLSVMGPLGRPFNIADSYKKVCIIGGGLGVFPLLFLLDELKKQVQCNVFLGFKTREHAVYVEEFAKSGRNVAISTEDGSSGYKGLVTDIFKRNIKGENYDIIYACGPFPMLQEVAKIARENRVKCQVSLEERMGCGIGACLVCACKTKQGDDDWKYSSVCKDGPVFWSDEVIFHEG